METKMTNRKNSGKMPWYLLLSIGLLLWPSSSFAIHNGLYSKSWTGCGMCHVNGTQRPCEDCHNNATGKNYSDMSAPEMGTHSSSVIGSNQYGTWEKECVDCHNPHRINGFDSHESGVRDPSHVLVDIDVHNATAEGMEYTFQITKKTVNYPQWADPATWGRKTRKETGLLFIYPDGGNYLFSKVLHATENTITIRNAWSRIPTVPWENPFHAKLIYGMFIRDSINGIAVDFSSPGGMARDESGTGTDPTPNGICQVCHTQTSHWRSDGTLANHFSGWNCIICHPHEKGFKPEPPDTCIFDDRRETTVLDQWNIDIQGGAGSTVSGQEGTAHPHGPDENGVWNIMNIPPLDGDPATLTTDPSINLVNRNGEAGSLTFSLIGEAGGWSGKPGQHTLIGDYVILMADHTAGYPDSLGINITGLEPGALYELIVRSSDDSNRTIKTSVDLDGDGSLDNDTPVTTLGGGITSSFTFYASPSGILVAEIAAATTNEANLAGLILKRIEVPREMKILDQWNVDIQGDGGSTYYGQEGTAHPHGPDENGVWNIMNIPPLDGDPATLTTDPSINLVNRNGEAGSLTFSLIGEAGGWSGKPGQHTLIGDYVILMADHTAGYPDSLGINITGLEPGALYELAVRSGENSMRTIKTTIDLDGDGDIDDETPVSTLTGGGGTASIFRFTANPSGVLIGEIATSTTNEANLAGFTLKKIKMVPVME